MVSAGVDSRPDSGQEIVQRQGSLGHLALETGSLLGVVLLLGLLHPGIDFRAAWEGLRSGNAVLHDQALDLLESELRPEMRSLLVPLVDPVVHGAERMRLAAKLSGTPVDSPEEAVKALASTGDPWLKACAAYAMLHGHLFEGAPKGEALRFYGWVAGFVGGALLLHFLMRTPALSPAAPAARRACEAVGFAAAGDVGLVLLEAA